MTIQKLLPAAACALLALATGIHTAGAQTPAANAYPQKPIRMVVPFPPGGPSDVVARIVGQKLAERMGQAVVIDNKAGANTIIGADIVAKAPPDGYTILMAIDNTLVMNQSLYTKLPYDPARDFEPIAKVVVSPLIVVTSAAGPQNMKALIAQAKAKPGGMSYGFGTFTSQLGGELIKSSLGINAVGVSYKGSAGTVQGLLSNDVTFIIDGVTAALPHIQSGKFRALANMGSSQMSALPNLPSVANEAGIPGFDVAVWLGLVAPRGTPDAIVQKLSSETAAVLAMPEVREKLNAIGLLPDYVPAAAFRSFMQAESTKWQKVITQADIKVQ
ncbi:MAG: hypothetical protein JWQ72_2860 [Polaromonas sp.]|nr:hypothetical protein [Polaromonas sp.]